MRFASWICSARASAAATVGVSAGRGMRLRFSIIERQYWLAAPEPSARVSIRPSLV